ncbi:MAG: ABC transporter ATP-binding protein [Candidatus Limnocylindrales bacterium]
MTLASQADPELLLSVEDLRVEFRSGPGRVRAVNGITFELAAHETLGIVGESGCGKSVTSLAIMGLLPKPAGRIAGGKVIFDGTDLVQLKADEMRDLRGRDVAMVFQDPMTSLNPVITIEEQLVEVIRAHDSKTTKSAAHDRAIELLELVGIPNPSVRLRGYAHQLSGGMRQRVMIAIALALNPKLIIADEPTTALDVTIQAQILELIQRVANETGAAIMLITHDLGVVAGMTQRIQVMYAGRIVETATTQDLFAHPRHPYTVGLLRSIPRLDLGDNRALIPIDGLPPDMTRERTGCPFAPRCAWAIEHCLTEDPELAPVVPGQRTIAAGPDANHRVACWHPATDAEAATGVPASGHVSAITAATQARVAAATASLIEPSQAAASPDEDT